MSKKIVYYKLSAIPKIREVRIKFVFVFLRALGGFAMFPLHIQYCGVLSSV